MQNDFEFENMRQQMTTLKNKLNHQEIVNDRMMRRSMKNEVNTITRRYYIIMALGLFMVPYGYWCFVKLCGLSLFFWIVTSIFMLVCVCATFYTLRKINDPNLMPVKKWPAPRSSKPIGCSLASPPSFYG